MKLSTKAILVLGFSTVGVLACGGSGSPPASTGGAGSTGSAGATGSAGTTGTAGVGSAGATGPAPEGGASGAAGSNAGGSGVAGDGAAGSSTSPDASAGGSPDAGVDGGGAGGHAGATGGAGGGGGGGKGGATGTAGVTGTAGATGTAGSSGAGNFAAHTFAPYVESWANINLTNLATTTGHKFYTLAFVIGGNGCAPSWNGDTAITANTTTFVNDVASLRKLGGDVIISFGGASGTELGDACTTVEALQAAYQTVITRYGLKWMDLDIESGAESHTAAVDRRNKALKNLKAANPGLRVSYTLAVDPSGLPQAQRTLLSNAKTNGLAVDVVNVMAMDYGGCNLDMGKAATDAASATHKQLQTLGVDWAVGVTPMTGTNDVACEVFSTSNAQTLVDFSGANDYVALLAFWAVGRDGNHAFLNIFKTFNK
jgi:chitinase